MEKISYDKAPKGKKQKSKGLVFISHATIDNKELKVADQIQSIFERNGYKVFCSSVPKRGISIGKQLFKEMNKNLEGCTLFFAIITDNYVRSPYCLYELCIARYLKKKIYPVLSSTLVEARIMSLLDKDIVNLKATKENAMNRCDELGLDEKESYKDFAKFLEDVGNVSRSTRPYIGMLPEEYKNILYYCDKEGIKKFGQGKNAYDSDNMDERIKNAKTVYVITTTGASLFKSLKENVIPTALRNGVDFNIIIPDRYSQFCQDVAIAECKRKNYTPVIERQNQNRIEQEFEDVHQYLNEAYCDAINNGQPPKGSIHCFSSRTLLRQTLLLAVNKDHSVWGWMTMTMPPLRSAVCPSLTFYDNDANDGLGKLLIKHCECLMRVAHKENRPIVGNTIANSFSSIKQNEAENYWKEKKEKAEIYMREKSCRFTKTLIEVASQHPLFEGKEPNQEFRNRLDFAIKLYFQMDKNAAIYVPGSKHSNKGDADAISLSKAGENYLLKKGICKEDIWAEAANVKYKGDDGVYNSADECYVAAKLFIEGDYGRLISVCSPYQIMRKSFHYLEFGVLPECYGIPSENMFHDVVSEYFGSLKTTVYDDHSWQAPNSETFVNSRKERMPQKIFTDLYGK